MRVVARSFALAGVLASLVAAAPARAQPTYSVLLDLDANPATGCSVTVDGVVFSGAEQVLETTQGVGSVTQVVRRVCTDPGTGTFGPPVVVGAPFSPPWPIGIGLGTDGANVIETYVPFADVGSPDALRVGFATSGPGGEDAIFPGRILWAAGAPIPSLSPWGLFALVALVGGAALLVLGRSGGLAAGGMAVLAVSLVAGTALAAIVLDGQPGDWSATDQMGTDPIDGPGADLRAAYARLEDGVLYVRFDAFDQGCAAGAVPFDGNFVVVEDVWADYSPGAVVPVQLVPGTNTFRILSTNNPFISNPGTSWMEVTLDPASALVTVASNQCFDYGPGFCLNVTGSGTASCDGVIDIVLNFGGFTGNRLVLRPQ